jgi:hypothetical protein
MLFAGELRAHFDTVPNGTGLSLDHLWLGRSGFSPPSDPAPVERRLATNSAAAPCRTSGLLENEGIVLTTGCTSWNGLVVR